MLIGILSLQGAFKEHQEILEKLNVKTVLVKNAKDVLKCDGIIFPGGESTSMSIIDGNGELFSEIKKQINDGKVIWGTCAGMILLSNEIIGKIDSQKNIGGLDVVIERNHFGSQIQSFVAQISYPKEFNKSGDFPGIFIRAPVIRSVGDKVKILCEYNGKIVAVEQNNLLGTSFHPELSNDYSWHKYFLEMVSRSLS